MPAPPPAASAIEASAPPEQAEVTLDGVPLFHVRGVASYPAEKRARAIAERIRAVAADRSVPVDALRIVEGEDRSNILAGERGIMSVVALDAESEGVPRDAMAQLFSKQIASAINIIIQVTRLTDGSRRVTSISEITGMEQDVITMQDIFTFQQTGINPAGQVVGRFRATGIRPKCADRLNTAGVPLPMDMFSHEQLVNDTPQASQSRRLR